MLPFQPTPTQKLALICKWTKPHGCLTTFLSPEELFSHLCDCHVGRKRSGNLSLNCGWEGCDHKAAKRDHMTSHMMVHCPLQSNVCGICQKTFKRSYDLRKHEVTHTAAHHELHTRSRAVVYQELEMPFSTQVTSSAAIDRGRVYSLPGEQLGGAFPAGPVEPAAPRAANRERSFSALRHSPYHRPHSDQQESSTHNLHVELSSTWNNYQFKFPSNRNHQRSNSIAEVGPYSHNPPLFDQFQFLNQYSHPPDPPAPHLPSNAPPMTASRSSAFSTQSNSHVPAPGDWSDIFSFVAAHSRRESEAYSIPSDDCSGSDALSGLFGSEPSSEIFRTTSLPCHALYTHPAAASSAYQNLPARHSLSTAVLPEHEPPAVLTDIQIRDLLAQQQQPYDQTYHELPSYLAHSAAPFQSTHNSHQLGDFECVMTSILC
ncbi:uncharacterized protein VP01_798g9 [Puccinia sorghi]|uniref:C2H2-type domain-containing protein n=1 Tax=Puccinia sorghi TaxID=27349 RepID=A0A0L6UAN9_9BASI|nr:uncharacterized protein VP01_798g9 [Puccinia sorghi]